MLSIFIQLLCITSIAQAYIRYKTDCLRFIAIGDWGGVTGIGQTPVARAMAEYADENPVDFIVSAGDNFYPSGVESATDEQFDFKWRDMYNQKSLKDLPWYITVGNHDYDLGGNEWYQVEFGLNESRWIFPNLWHDKIMKFGNDEGDEISLNFIFLDTQALRRGLNNVEEQRKFYRRQLNDTINNKYTWNIVIAHHPIYSTGNYGPVMNFMYDEVVKPILENEEINIDFIVTGHDHNLQHLKSNMSDIDFVVSGAGGAFPYFKDDDKELELNRMGITLERFDDAFGFVVFNVCQDNIRFEFVDDEATVNYVYTKYKN